MTTIEIIGLVLGFLSAFVLWGFVELFRKVKRMEEHIEFNKFVSDRKMQHVDIVQGRLVGEVAQLNKKRKKARKRKKKNQRTTKNKNPHNRIPIPPEPIKSWEEITLKDIE